MILFGLGLSMADPTTHSIPMAKTQSIRCLSSKQRLSEKVRRQRPLPRSGTCRVRLKRCKKSTAKIRQVRIGRVENQAYVGMRWYEPELRHQQSPNITQHKVFTSLRFFKLVFSAFEHPRRKETKAWRIPTLAHGMLAHSNYATATKLTKISSFKACSAASWHQLTIVRCELFNVYSGSMWIPCMPWH